MWTEKMTRCVCVHHGSCACSQQKPLGTDQLFGIGHITPDQVTEAPKICLF